MKLGKEFYYLAVISIFLLIHSLYFNYIDDDAFIGLRYAKNFVEGYGLVFNIGEKVEGYSAFLFVVSEGILTKLSFSPVITSRLPGLLLGTATLYVVYLFSCMISKKNTTFNYLACVLLSVNGAFALWILGGTDIHMFTFLVLLGSYFYVRENKSHGVKFLLYSSAFFAFASLARWEGVLFFIVT